MKAERVMLILLMAATVLFGFAGGIVALYTSSLTDLPDTVRFLCRLIGLLNPFFCMKLSISAWRTMQEKEASKS